jgi:hypothetical protein
VRVYPFSRGHISKEIPLGTAVIQYLGFAPQNFWESATDSRKTTNIGSLPPDTIDMGLRKGAWPHIDKKGVALQKDTVKVP